MQERNIIIISLTTIIIGLGFLFFYAEKFNPTAIENIDTANIEESVKIKGIVSKMRIAENAVFLELEGEKVVKIDVIFFPEERILLNEGDYVEIYGQVEEYNGKKEVIASKVVLK